MQEILLINPNSSESTTAMMAQIAQHDAPTGARVTGLSARQGPAMIVSPQELEAAALEVAKVWLAHRTSRPWAGVIVSAFGDPGLELVRASCEVPVVGICEASMLEASAGGRRFGIATVTPELVGPIDGRAAHLGLLGAYSGIRLTRGEPLVLAADPKALEDALAGAVRECIDLDGAQAVIIGGGPLGQAALALAPRFEVPVIAPISAAMRLLIERMAVAAPLH